MSIKVLLSELIARKNVEGVSIDSDITADAKICRCDEVIVFVHILVLPALKESALHDPRVLLCGLINRDRVITHKEGDNKATFNIFRHAGIEASSETENLAFIVN